jgi:hypothetical protein
LTQGRLGNLSSIHCQLRKRVLGALSGEESGQSKYSVSCLRFGIKTQKEAWLFASSVQKAHI